MFTFVNVDDDLRPKEVPEVFPNNYAEDAQYLRAYRKRIAYKAKLAEASQITAPAIRGIILGCTSIAVTSAVNCVT